MGHINRMFNCSNPYQGKYKKVLCICSAGLLRSPTAALILSQEPYNYNTRAAGLDEGHALIYADDVLLEWADEIVCMDEWQLVQLKKRTDKPVINLQIGDIHAYRDTKLAEEIGESYNEKKNQKEA